MRIDNLHKPIAIKSSALQAERSEVIICPSFDALASCTGTVANSPIKIGAQTVYRYDL